MIEVPSAYWPYPFLKNAAARRALWEARLTDQITSSDITLEDAGTNGWLIHLPWDSKFFGGPFYKLAYLTGANPAAVRAVLAKLEGQAVSRGARYLFAFLPPSESVAVDCLKQAGWQGIEDRVSYWHPDLTGFRPAKRYAFREAQSSDLPALTRVAVEAVNPRDRFRADSFFEPARVDQLFAEWIRASVSGGFADAVLIPDQAEPHAFMTLKYLRSEWEILGVPIAQLVLNAVAPGVSGWYPKMVSESLLHLREKGARMATITTQAGHQAVLRTLEHLGFVFSHATMVLRKVFP